MARIATIKTATPERFVCTVFSEDALALRTAIKGDLDTALAWCRMQCVYRIELDGKPYASGYPDDCAPLKNTPAEPPVAPSWDAFLAMISAVQECLDAEQRRRTGLRAGSPAYDYTTARINRLRDALRLATAHAPKPQKGTTQ